MGEASTKYAVCEVEDVRADLKIAAADTSYDELIRRLINGVSGVFESYTGCVFIARDFASEKYDGNGRAWMMLKWAPIIRLSAVMNDTTTVAPANYVLYPNSGRLQLIDGTVFVSGPQKVSISGRRGFERQDMPEDIIMAARTWVCHRFKIIDKQRWGISSQTVTEESFSFQSGAMPDDVREVLDSYRGLR